MPVYDLTGHDYVRIDLSASVEADTLAEAVTRFKAMIDEDHDDIHRNNSYESAGPVEVDGAELDGVALKLPSPLELADSTPGALRVFTFGVNAATSQDRDVSVLARSHAQGLTAVHELLNDRTSALTTDLSSGAADLIRADMTAEEFTVELNHVRNASRAEQTQPEGVLEE